jgi:PAS domain S-box-containing protein
MTIDPGVLLEALLASSLDLIYFKDVQSRFIRYSRSLALHFGVFSTEGLKGKSDFDTYGPEQAKPRYEAEQQIIRTGKPQIGHLEQSMRADGQVRWLLTTKMPSRDAQGNIVGTFGISKDVTELKGVESQLAETGSLLETLLDNSPDAIYYKDRESRFVHFSKAFAKMFSVSDPNSLRGRTDFDFFTKEHAQPAFDDEQEIIRSGKPMIGKVEKETHPDGRVTWCITTKMPWRAKDGSIIGTFGTSKDITALKESEAKLERVHKQLLATSRMAGMAEVATSVLHNVGNVLNSVNVSASLLKDHLQKSRVASLVKVAALLKDHSADLSTFLVDDPKGKQLPEFLSELAKCLVNERDSLLGEISHLTKNVDHIKEIVSMQQNYAKVSGVVETVKVPELVEDALGMNAGALVRHGIQLVREYSPELPPINVDKHKVLQILVNLIGNAKYACDETNRQDKKLVLRIATNHDRVRITVQDNGTGIARENMNRIFNHGFTTRKNGHGFGLHSGALAAKELGGSLTVYSDGPGTGASFTLELPCVPPDADAS